MLNFILAKEIDGDRLVVEIWDGLTLVGCIYPHETYVTIVSKYLENVEFNKTHPPKAFARFKKRK